VIITKTPYRVSFFGGGSDYFEWYSRFGGEVLTSTIDYYCYVCLRYMPKFLDTKYRIFWSQTETPNRIQDIQHPGVRGCLEYLNIQKGIEINHMGDLPARSGLGSSSAFTVGMLHALHLLEGNNIDKANLAKQAIAVEQDVLKETVGIQDQIECAWGGLNHIKFHTNGEYSLQPLLLTDKVKQSAQDHLVLFFTDKQRFASDIAADQINHIDKNKGQLHGITNLVRPAAQALKAGDIESFGKLLDESWMLKRSLSKKITSSGLDDIYDKALKAGAYGGKLLGAGGGGFFLFCVPPDKRQALIDSLGLIHIPFKFEYNGSHAI